MKNCHEVETVNHQHMAQGKMPMQEATQLNEEIIQRLRDELLDSLDEELEMSIDEERRSS